MKINRIFMLLAASSMMLASCSDIVDNDNRKGDIVDDLQGSNIHLISAGTEFIAGGETKTIVASTEVARVEALYQQSTDPTVVNEPEWLTFNIKGKTVEVTAAPNSSTQSRDVMVRLYSAGGDFTEVNLQQQGVVFVCDAPSAIVLKDAAATRTYNILKTADGVTFVTTASWLHAKANADGTLVITADPNNTGSFRGAIVKVMFGELVLATIKVTQGEINDIVGAYYFQYYDNDDAAWYYMNAEIAKDGDTFNISFPDYEWTFPLGDVDADALTVSVPNACYVGMFQAYYMYTLLGNSDAGYITYSDQVTYTIAFSGQFDTDGSFYGYGQFKDNGSWSSYPVNSLYFYALSSDTFDWSQRVGSLAICTTPELIKVEPTPAPANKPALRPSASPATKTLKKGSYKIAK